MELQVYLQGTDSGNIQGVIKGLLIYQGVSSSFWHCLGGSQQKLSQTFQKTKNVNIQLLLKSEPVYFSILKKASKEIFSYSSLSEIPKNIFYMIVQILINSDFQDNRLMDLIGKWYEDNKDENNSEILNLLS